MKSKFRSTYAACFIGYIVQGIAVNLAPIFFIIFQTDYKISYASLANLILITFATQLFIDAISVKLVDVLGLKRMALIAHISATLGLVGLGVLPFIMAPFAGIAISLFFAAIGSGFIEVIISPIIDAIPKNTSKSVMSFLHSFYCWGQMSTILISTLLLLLFGRENWRFIPFIWAVIPFINIFIFIKAPMPEIVSKEERTPLKKLFKSRNFIILLIIMICSGAAEISISQWASIFAEKGLGVTKAVGDLLGPCLFAFFMGTGRVIFGLLGTKVNNKKALGLCGFFTVVCYLITIFVPIPVIGLLGVALTGLGVSFMWPGTLSLGSELFPMGGMSVFSFAALCGDIGCTLGPWIAGQVSDAFGSADAALNIAEKVGSSTEQIGLRAGLLVCAIFPMIMAIAVHLIRSKKENNEVKNENN